MWDLDCERGSRARAAMDTIRSLQEQAIRSLLLQTEVQRADKVIVAGDFNELGLLIEQDHDFWNPLPDCVPNASCTNVGNTHGLGQCDVVAVGGSAVHSTRLSYQRHANFGSDHHGVGTDGV